MALAKCISYRTDIVADMSAKYPLVEKGIPLGNTALRLLKAYRSLPRGTHGALTEVYTLIINAINMIIYCHCQGVNANHYVGWWQLKNSNNKKFSCCH